MTDKIGLEECCNYYEGQDRCQSVYHSCADISINGSIPVKKYVHSNPPPQGPYTQESAEWTQVGNSWFLLKHYTPYNHTAKCPGYPLYNSSTHAPTPPPQRSMGSVVGIKFLVLAIIFAIGIIICLVILFINKRCNKKTPEQAIGEIKIDEDSTF